MTFQAVPFAHSAHNDPILQCQPLPDSATGTMRLMTDPFALPAFILSIVGLVVASIGALTGVAALVWQINTRTRGAHRVTVEVSNAVIVDDSDESDVMICVEAINSGASAIGISSWGFELSNKRGGFAIPNPVHPSTPLPHMLVPGTNAKFFVPASNLGAQIKHNPDLTVRDLRAFVQLATGRKAYTRRRGIPLADEFWRS